MIKCQWIWMAALGVCSLSLSAALPERVNPYLVDRADLSRPVAAKESRLAPGQKGEPARSAEPGGEFSFALKVDDVSKPQRLAVQYSGDETPPRGKQLLFRVLLDGVPLAVQGLDRNVPQNFFEEYYAIPPELVKGKKSVTVTFRAWDAKSAVGGVYDVAVIRSKTRDAMFDRCDNAAPGLFLFTEPDGPQAGTASQPVNDSVIDFQKLYGVEVEFSNDAVGAPLEVYAAPEVLTEKNLDTAKDVRRFQLQVSSGTMTIPFSGFNTPTSDSGILRRIKSLAFRVGGKSPKLLSIRPLAGLSFHAGLPRRSLAAEPGAKAVYRMTLTNTELVPQKLFLSPCKRGWEAMTVEIEPAALELQPGASGEATVSVTVADKIPPGGRETQSINILPSANPAAARSIELITVSAYPHPYTIHTAAGWAAVREKAATYDWAKRRAEQYRAEADKWRVPDRAVYMISGDTRRPCLASTAEEKKVMDTAIAWQLFRDKKYAEKVRKFLLMLSDPADGYLLTRQMGNQAAVQEGEYFQHIAQAYDLILDSGVLSKTDCEQIESTLRIYAEEIAADAVPAGANWAVSAQTGALFCAVAMQDLALVNRLLYAPSMLIDKFTAYTMSDGWWYECTVSYNLWCTEEFIQIGLALDPFGYSLLTEKFPVNYLQFPDYKKGGPKEREISRNIEHGHSFRVRGDISQAYVSIKNMAEALLPFLDYRGWMFGMNDSYENRVGGGRFELAYYAFRDPRFAAFLKMEEKRDNLLYGVPELPENTPEVGSGSAYSDNAGILMLRSTQKNPRDRIQAVLKYGTHGGYHGHWDLSALLSVMRYGRSFYNPEMIWYSYAPFLYAFYVQSSLSSNMVTVDLKQQEAADSSRRLFHTGKLMQAGCVETTAAWSYPPYGGLRYTMGFDSFKAKAEAEGRYMPAPENPPPFGVLTGFTEPVLQRRLLAVTDDYIVIADSLKGTTEHDFDQLFHIKGLRSLEAPTKTFAGHSAQLSDDPLGAAQLVTDVNRCEVTGTAVAKFLTRFGKDADNAGSRIFGEDGDLFLNLHYAWPNGKRQIFTGLAPENHETQRKLAWSVSGDGKVLKDGKFGAWILGDAKIDLDIRGVKMLELSCSIDARRNVNTLFWGDPELVTADGRVLKLNALKYEAANVKTHSFGADRDYRGGKINIAGNDYAFGLPADPNLLDKPAVYRFDLSGLNAVRLKAAVGGDYPVGPETERRVTIGERQRGTSARFLTVMEPFEKESAIASVEADSPDHLTVRLKDGRVQTFMLKNLDGDGGGLSIEMTEEKDGKILRESARKSEGAI